MIFDSEIDLVLCINLERRQDRFDRCRDLFQRLDIPARFIDAVDASELEHECSFFGSSARYACLVSHFMALKYAADHCEKAVLILEDDIDINPFFRMILESVDVPITAKVLFLGGSHRRGPVRAGGSLYKLSWTLDNHAYIVKHRAISEVMRYMADPAPVDGSRSMTLRGAGGCLNKDVLFARMQEQGDVYGICPALVWQISGRSDNTRADRRSNYHTNGQEV